jgi:hypothetical protein
MTMTHVGSARELLRAPSCFSKAQAEPLFPAYETNKPARAEPFWSELKTNSCPALAGGSQPGARGGRDDDQVLGQTCMARWQGGRAR